MIKILFLLFLLAFISSCSWIAERSDIKDPVLLVDTVFNGYGVRIYELDTKVDSEGKVQCANYFFSTRSDSLCQVYGGSVVEIVATLLKIPEKRVDAQNSNFTERFYDYQFRGNNLKSTAGSDTSMIESVKQLFEVEVLSDTVLKDGYKLTVHQPNRLAENGYSRQTEPNGISYSGGRIESDGATLSEYVNMANSLVNYEIFDAAPDSVLLKMEWEINDQETLQKSLSEYGLKLVPHQQAVVQHRIQPQSPKDKKPLTTNH